MEFRSYLLSGIAVCALAAGSPVAAQQLSGERASESDGGRTVVDHGRRDGDGAVRRKDGRGSDNEIVVTGTRIAGNLISNAPITVVDEAYLRDRGLARIEDALSQLPQVTPMMGLQGSTWTSGPSRVNLRGLGPGRTLTLLNGERVTNDVSVIPGALIKRIDILTGGASAVYGSDAVAGVVNYIVDRDFDGIAINAEVSAFQHENDSIFLKELQKTGGYPTVKDSVLTGENYLASIAAGKRLFNGTVNVSGYFTYKKAEPMKLSQLDTTNCPLSMYDPYAYSPVTRNDKWACGYTAYNPYGYFAVGNNEYSNAANGDRSFRPYSYLNSERVPRDDYLQRSDRTINVGGFLTANLFSDIKLTTDFMYTNYRQSGALSLANTFYSYSARVNCDNPYLGAQQAQILCGAAAGTTALSPTFTAQAQRRDLTQKIAYGSTDWRASAGLSGTLFDQIRFNASYVRSRNIIRNSSTGVYSQTLNNKFASALQVRNVNGVATCLSVINGTDPSCVPIDAFSSSSQISDAAVAWLTGNASSFVISDLEVMNATISGSLAPYGIKSPFANEGVRFAVTAERRNNGVKSQGFGEWSNWALYAGTASVNELGAEIDIPLVEDVPFLRELSVNGAYRLSDYDSLNHAVHTWKAELGWQPVLGLRLRTSYNRAIRVSVQERLTGQNKYTGIALDLCAPPQGNVTTVQRASFQQCAAGGMTQAQYDWLTNYRVCDAAGRCPVTYITGGNPELDPEKSNSITMGFVVQPAKIPGLSLSVDGYDIKVKGTFAVPNTSIAFSECYVKGDPLYCALYSRDPATGQLQTVDGRFQNAGFTHTRGIDFTLNYAIDPARFGVKADIGSFDLSFNGTRTLQFETQPLPNSATLSCLGYFGFACSTPSPRWRHIATFNWRMPWAAASVGLTWRYVGSTKNSKLSSDPNLASQPNLYTTDAYPLAERIAPWSYFDIAFNVALTKQVGLRINAQNIFDKGPPLIGTDAYGAIGTGYNTWPTYYDVRGRTLRAAISARF